MDIAKKLFQFLKEFNKLKTKPRLDIDSFEKVLWFYRIPNEKECYSIIHNFNVENVNFDKRIEIKKTKKKAFPYTSSRSYTLVKRRYFEQIYNTASAS